jgi:hypothetical protein
MTVADKILSVLQMATIVFMYGTLIYGAYACIYVGVVTIKRMKNPSLRRRGDGYGSAILFISMGLALFFLVGLMTIKFYNQIFKK